MPANFKIIAGVKTWCTRSVTTTQDHNHFLFYLLQKHTGKTRKTKHVLKFQQRHVTWCFSCFRQHQQRPSHVFAVELFTEYMCPKCPVQCLKAMATHRMRTQDGVQGPCWALKHFTYEWHNFQISNIFPDNKCRKIFIGSTSQLGKNVAETQHKWLAGLTKSLNSHYHLIKCLFSSLKFSWQYRMHSSHYHLIKFLCTCLYLH